jgi:hypothetical protein
MPTRYGDLYELPGNITCQGLGVSPGPSGGDGWQILARLPQANLPAGTGRYVIALAGLLSNIRQVVATAGPQRGVIQLCLGLDTGAKSPVHQHVVSLREQAGALEGLPFGFVAAMTSTVSDPYFGGTFNNASGSQWCLWGRVYTNGDPLTYQCEFDVGDLTWLWWDTDRIAVGDFHVEAYDPTSPLALTTTETMPHYVAAATGTVGQKWLHFGSVVYEPPIGAPGVLPAPIVQFGYTTTASLAGFVAKIGSDGRWAQSRGDSQINTLGAGAIPISSHWAWWYGAQPAGPFSPAVRALDRQTAGAGSATRLRRYVYVGIRLDNLLDVLTRADVQVLNATANRFSTPSEGETWIAMERPATGLVSDPCVMVHGIVGTTGRQDYAAEIWTNRAALHGVTSFALSNHAQLEGASYMAFIRRGLGASFPAIQYRFRFTGGLNAAPVTLPVRDFYAAQFHFVRDALPDPALPATPSNPIVISPGREAPAVASLPALPFPPDTSYQESWEPWEEGSIQGATGYRRTWPLFARPRRTIPLQWSGMDETDARTLHAFLVASAYFRWTPNRDAEIGVFQMEDPELVQISGQAYAVQVVVAELVWTGP